MNQQFEYGLTQAGVFWEERAGVLNGVAEFSRSPLLSAAMNRVIMQGLSAGLIALAAHFLQQVLSRLSAFTHHFAQECRMSKRLAACAALAVAMLLTVGAFAQEPPPQGGERWGHRGGPGGPPMDPQARLDRMSAELNLSAEQKEKIKPILENEAKQMQELRQGDSTAPQDRRARVQEIRQDTMAKIRPILNSDQQKKWDERQKQMEQRREQGPRGERGRPGEEPNPQ